LHVHGAAEGAAHDFPFLASVGLYVLVVLAGTLAAPALSRTTVRGRLRTGVVTVFALVYAVLVALQVARHELPAVVAAGVVVALAVALVALWRDARVEQAAAAVVLVAAQIPVVGTGFGVAHLFAVLAHLAAASIWVGGVLHVVLVTATAGRTDGAQAARRFSVFAVFSSALLVGSGVVLMLVHHIGRAVLAGSTYGHVLLAKMAALGLAVVVGFTMRRRATARPARWWPRLIRTEAVVLASALGLGAVLVGLPDPEPAIALTAPGLAHVRLGDESGTLFLVRRNATSGWLEYVAGDDDAPDVRISTGGAQEWHPTNDGAQVTTVALDDGSARLRLHYGAKTIHFRLPATALPRTQPDDPITADHTGQLQYALGRSLAAAASTTADRVDAAAECPPAATAVDEGRAFGHALIALGITTARVLGDGSSRAREFARGVVTAGVAASARERAVVLAGDQDSALAALQRLANSATGGIYLAPWLLDGDVLAATRERALPLLAVASLVDPMAPLADRYRGALNTLAARAQPSEAGLLGFLSVVTPELTASLRVYAAAPVGFLPGILNVGHEHGSVGWFPNGTLAPISVAQPVTEQSRSCSPTS
jgi:putative copper export protein